MFDKLHKKAFVSRKLIFQIAEKMSRMLKEFHKNLKSLTLEKGDDAFTVLQNSATFSTEKYLLSEKSPIQIIELPTDTKADSNVLKVIKNVTTANLKKDRQNNQRSMRCATCGRG